MSPTVDALLNAALALSADDRALLAERLLKSLDSEALIDLDPAWAEEIERRIQAYEEGRSQAIPAEQVFRSLPLRKKS